MIEESKKETKSGKYSALEISLIMLKVNDVLCGSPEQENGAPWVEGDDGWNMFD